jgi:hypothetical protein
MEFCRRTEARYQTVEVLKISPLITGEGKIK